MCVCSISLFGLVGQFDGWLVGTIAFGWFVILCVCVYVCVRVRVCAGGD